MMESNEPYNRLDDSSWNGTMWGAISGAAGGLGVGGAAYYNHAKIPHKAGVMQGKHSEIQGDLRAQQKKTSSTYTSQLDKLQQKRNAIQDPIGGSTKMDYVNSSINNFKRSSIDKRIDQVNAAHERTMSGIDAKFDQAEKKYSKWQDPKGLQEKSFYNKRLGSWKGRAGLGLASAGIGAIAGATIDHFNK